MNMQTLHTILSVVFLLGYSAICLMAATAFSRLTRLQKDVDAMKFLVGRTFRLILMSHTRESFRELNEMKDTFNRLVENEQFEDARKLKDAISDAEESAKRLLGELDKFGIGSNVFNIREKQ